MKLLAVIPARGGSKGVPRKNLRAVGGRSLLRRAIDGARESGAVDRVLVSTDDEEIRGAALAAGAEAPFLRPGHLASDTASSVDAVLHAVTEFERFAGARFDAIVLLEPTSPFRPAARIAEAAARFARGDVRSVVSVCPVERKPENIFRRGAVLERYIKDPAARHGRRQDMNDLCRLNSAIYVVGRDDLLRERDFLLPPIGHVDMNELESINIDTPLDLAFAEFVAGRIADPPC